MLHPVEVTLASSDVACRTSAELSFEALTLAVTMKGLAAPAGTWSVTSVSSTAPAETVPRLQGNAPVGQAPAVETTLTPAGSSKLRLTLLAAVWRRLMSVKR